MTPELAITNNASLYCSIFRAHGLPSRMDEHYWSTDAEPPPYYSRMVTRTRGPRAREAQLSRLEELAVHVRGRQWGFKDSFDELPEDALAGLGLRVLFRAWWYGSRGDCVTSELETDLVVQRVTSAEALLSWEDGWRQASPVGPTRVFPDSALEDSSLELFTMSLAERVAGGFILNRSDAAVGLSNVFRLDNAQIQTGTFLRECARQARCLHADRAVVGYGPLSDVDALVSLGFIPLGPLAVWASP